MKRNNRKKLNIGVKKAVAVMTSAFMLVSSLCLPEVSQEIKDIVISASAKTSHPMTTYNVNSLKELYEFSEKYKDDPDEYQYVDLIIDINGDITIQDELEFDSSNGKVKLHFYPIGTSEYPFGGKITLSMGMNDTQSMTVDKPLFDYIYDSVEIVNINDTSEDPTPQSIELVRENAVDSPMFANNVVQDKYSGSTPARWDFTVSCSGSCTGVIGAAGTGSDAATVDMALLIKSTGSISSETEDVGIICGRINKNSSVTARISSDAANAEDITAITTNASDKSAGGFAGRMEVGSSLTICTGTRLKLSSVDRAVSGKKYAGGLVGYNDRGRVIIKETPDSTSETVYQAKGTVKGNTAGGVFGYYRVTASENRFSPDYYLADETGCKISGVNAGGLVGELAAVAADIEYSSHTVKSQFTSGYNASFYGGIVGLYSNTTLTNSFVADDANVIMTSDGGTFANNAYCGGVIGKIQVKTSAVYIKTDNLTVDSAAFTAAYFGGAVGGAGDSGSMLDIGSIKVKFGNGTSNTFSGGGVVGSLTNGVLRLSGVTDMSQAVCGEASGTRGQIAGLRMSSLVYALGSGEGASSSYGSGWRFIRSSQVSYADDIGTWGEVVRINDIENTLVTFNNTAHTVKVAASVKNMTSAADFAATALNMQLNDGDKGALLFTDTGKRDTLLGSALTVSGEIDLEGTGITGFMRDGSSSDDENEIKSFTGSLSKSGSGKATIKLAAGERYGIVGSSAAADDAVCRGDICTHRFSGLFARTGDGASVSDITIDGYLNIYSSADKMNIGGAVAYLKDSMTFDAVNAKETINCYSSSGEGHTVGGLIGKTNCAAGKKVTISGTSESSKAEIAPVINLGGSLLTNDNHTQKQSIGGVIGFISSTAGSVSSQTETEIKNITLSANIDASAASAAANVSAAGLVSDIAWDGEASAADRDTRKLTLTNIDIKDTIIKTKAATSTGGVLGYRWFSTDAEFTNVNLLSNVELNSNAKALGGLVYRATGCWSVNDGGINIAALSIKNGTSAASPDSLGIIVHDGYYSNSGLFLEMLAHGSYTLASGLTIPDMTASGKIYDELVACLSDSKDTIPKNEKNGIISYRTDGDYYMTGSGSRNSYQNVYNKAVVNDRSRYYYNADRSTCGDRISEDPYKLLFWSLKRYAPKNIKRCFTDPFSNNVISGTFDLDHISYYPIDIDNDVTIGASTIVFYNNDIESTETASDTKRSTRDGKSQHYMMHMGLFRNVTAKVTTTGNITMYGSVGVNGSYSGALINGKLTGSLITGADNTITLGIYDSSSRKQRPLEISDTNRYLLINSIGDKAVLELNGVTIGKFIWANILAYSAYDTTGGKTYASSLIGDVQGVGISMRFANLSIDARNSESAVTSLKNVYATTRSIFKNATLLNKYDVDSTSVAIYNFAESEDWSGSSHIAKVTYGKELTDSVSYANEEDRYYDETRNYIDPVNTPSNSTAYDFSSDFLPYVRYYNKDSVSGAPAAVYELREIKVNVEPSDLKSGCGSYDHPYVVSSKKQLIGIAAMIDNSSHIENALIANIMLPDTDDGSHWCMDNSGVNTCNLYEYVSGDDIYRYTNGSVTKTWAVDDVREYLAGAYYQIEQTITLDNTFTGLGALDSSGKYAFKGVIVGINENVTIENKSNLPFIKVSNGSVVRQLKFDITNSSGDVVNAVVTGGSNANIFNYTDPTKTNLVYGGVIGKIMGGDNIIDNVTVNYVDGSLKVSGTNTYLYTVGGYVGVLVNGALMFRNIDSSNFNSSSFRVYTDSGNFASETDTKHLYINPYVGRVLNGYAIHETDSYSCDTGVYSLNNTNKNYKIPDIKSDITESGKLYYDTVSGKSRVNIPDGQSLFILSLITQSGAGTATSANGDYAYAIGYDGTTRYNASSAALNTATHLARYDKVGNVTAADKTDTSGDYYLSAGDTKNSKKAVPYIISHYTKKDGSNYPARMMTGNTKFMKLSTAGGTYDLPDSFRGIGAICNYDISGPYSMKIYGLEGNGATINISLDYKIYNYTDDNYINNVYGANGVYVGFGLFNNLNQQFVSQKSFNMDKGYYIGDFTLSGSVKVGEYSKSDGSVVKGSGLRDSKGNYYARQRHVVGGVVGGIPENSYINFVKLKISGLTVSGMSSNSVGGYVGRTNVTDHDTDSGTGMSYIFVNGCDTEALFIEASNSGCGGVLGVSYSGFACLYVNTAQNTDTSDEEHIGDDGYFKSNMEMSVYNEANIQECGIGAILGSMRNGYNANVWINNVSVTGFRGSLGGREIEPKFENNQNISCEARYASGVGGMIGYLRKASTLYVTNCNVKNINIKGYYAGGIIGNAANDGDASNKWGTAPKTAFYNCNVSCDDTSHTYSIEGLIYSGGLSGQFISSRNYSNGAVVNKKGVNVPGYSGEDYKYDIDGCVVSDYTITQSSTANNTGVGGIIGCGDKAERTIVNSTVHDCIFKTKSSTSHGIGCIVGYTAVNVSGYNISAYNNVFADYNGGTSTNAKYGNFIGITSSKAIKVAGFSRQNNKFRKSASSSEIVSKDRGDGTTSGYIVCADYMGVNTTDEHGTAMSGIIASGAANVGEGAGGEYFPYVTVSPFIDAGGDGTVSEILTGDGISCSDNNNDGKADSILAATIYSEAKSSTAAAGNRIKYSTAAADLTNVKTLLDNASEEGDTAIKLTTYFNEIGRPAGYTGEDFPIISIGGTDDYTAYIESYIRTLTNTSDDYSKSADSKYRIDVYPCQCIDGSYQRVSGDCGLEHGATNGVYYYRMNPSSSVKADSVAGNDQISMIDVGFLDPADKTKVAYHLYVPVLTKKLLKFDFSSSAMQGTKYEPSSYVAKFPESYGPTSISKLAAGFDSWQTIYVRYEYTAEDINDFLSTGKGLNWNTDTKAVNFMYRSKQTVAGSTQFVLLDNNHNADKEYYALKTDLSTVESNNSYDVIDFSAFTTTRDKGSALAEPQAFKPQDLNDIADKLIVYSTDTNGAYVECAKKDAVVYAYDSNGDNIKYFKAAEGGSDRYTIRTTGDIHETYYISMYTFGDDNDTSADAKTSDVYGFSVECPTTFPSKVITCQKRDYRNTNIYLGNFLEQTVRIIEATTDEKITQDNHVIYAKIESTLKFVGLSSMYFQQNLAGETIYQGFDLYLNRYDSGGHIVTDDCKIKGSPRYTYEKYIGDTRQGGTYTDNIDEDAPYLYLSPVEVLIPSITEQWESTQYAVVNIDFGTDETKLENEFPSKSRTNDYSGISLDAIAKLDFVSERVPYSNNVQEIARNEARSERYYIDRTNDNGELTLTARDQSNDDEYDKYGKQSRNKSSLGINALYIDTGDLFDTKGCLEHIEAGLDYDISKLPDEVTESGNYTLDLTITLEQKNDSDQAQGYTYKKVNIVDTSQGSKDGYLTDFELIGSTGSPVELVPTTENTGQADEHLCFTYSMPMSGDSSDWAIKYSDTGSQKHLTADINFDAKTSALLEEIQGYKYANYKLTVKAVISNGTVSYAGSDHIIYTNAKVNARYVKAS